MELSIESRVLTSLVPFLIPHFHHLSIFGVDHIKQSRKSLLKGQIPTPFILLEFHPPPIAHLKLDPTTKSLPSTFDYLPHHISFLDNSRAPSSLFLTIFTYSHLLPKRISLCSKSPTPFTKKCFIEDRQPSNAESLPFVFNRQPI